MLLMKSRLRRVRFIRSRWIMIAGEHTFYAIVVDENGRESHPGSATYILKE